MKIQLTCFSLRNYRVDFVKFAKFVEVWRINFWNIFPKTITILRNKKKKKFKEVLRFYFDCSCKVMFRRNNCGRINHASFYCMNIKGTKKPKRESVKSILYSGNTSKNIHMEEKCTRKLYWFCQSYHFFGAIFLSHDMMIFLT